MNTANSVTSHKALLSLVARVDHPAVCGVNVPAGYAESALVFPDILLPCPSLNSSLSSWRAETRSLEPPEILFCWNQVHSACMLVDQHHHHLCLNEKKACEVRVTDD